MSFLRSPLAPRHYRSPIEPYRRSIPSLPFEILLLLLAQDDPPPPPSLLAKLCLLNSEVYFLVLPYLYRKVTLDKMALSQFFWGLESKRPKTGKGSFVFKLPPELAHVPKHYTLYTEPLGLVRRSVQSDPNSTVESNSSTSGTGSPAGSSKSILRAGWKENMSKVVNQAQGDNSSAQNHTRRVSDMDESATRIPVEPCAATERRKRYSLSLVKTLVLLDGADTQTSEELGYIVNAPNPHPFLSVPSSPLKSVPVSNEQGDGKDQNSHGYDDGHRRVPDNLFICQSSPNSSTPILDSFAPFADDTEVEQNIFRRFSSGSIHPTSTSSRPGRPPVPVPAHASARVTQSNTLAPSAEDMDGTPMMPRVRRLVLHAEMLSNLAQWRFISHRQQKDHEFVTALQGILGHIHIHNHSGSGSSSGASPSNTQEGLIVEIRGSIASLSDSNAENAIRYPAATPNPQATRRLAAEVLENLCDKWTVDKVVWHDLGTGGGKSVDHLAWIKGAKSVEWHFMEPDWTGAKAVERAGAGAGSGSGNENGEGRVDEAMKITPVQRASVIRGVLLKDMWRQQDQHHLTGNAPTSSDTTTNTNANLNDTRRRTRYTIIGAGSGISTFYTSEEGGPVTREYEAQTAVADLVRSGSGDLGGGPLSEEMWGRVEWVASSEMGRADMGEPRFANVNGSGQGGGCGCYSVFARSLKVSRR
ncbi:hypothetical protein I316_01897 [Kwoniella heveanensis BCC8398]|uniref:Uncharacterized protein n=1 Tax=Kwoniella heveanensis BCC8398 TaxID=1296120 RepID=A0A1B9H068_9TREE|nr:hypothetical protein I316_01897 [Kwoniella heveanensis BCC8398]